mmetsp:Transcript_6071/g.18890  ORF Transcript_6071/g.18890 Transcript_6071/m.18890 type:complete len:238 (-) Transcript_6071:864-1577(-)
MKKVTLAWRVPDAWLRRRAPGRHVPEGVDHVSVRPLALVDLTVFRAPVRVTPVAVGAAVAPELPLEKRHGLDVHKLAQRGRGHDVGVAHARGVAVGGDLHHAPGLHEGAEGAEEELHEVLMPPADERVPVEEALHHAGVREVVVHGPKLPRHVHEAWVHREARAVHVVQDLRAPLLERLHCLVDLLVALPQGLNGLESRGHDAPHVAEALAVLREEQREGEVGVAQDEGVGGGVDEL